MKPTSGIAAARKRPGALAYASCIRYREVLVLQGSPLLGAAFAMGELSTGKIARLLLFAPAYWKALPIPMVPSPAVRLPSPV